MENQTVQTNEITINVTNFPTLQEVERQYLNLVLSKTAGSKAEAAKILGVSTKTIYNKLDIYNANQALANITEKQS